MSNIQISGPQDSSERAAQGAQAGGQVRGAAGQEPTYNKALIIFNECLGMFAGLLKNLDIYMQGLTNFTNGYNEVSNLFAEMLTSATGPTPDLIASFIKNLENIYATVGQMEKQYQKKNRTKSEQQAIDNMKSYVKDLVANFQSLEDDALNSNPQCPGLANIASIAKYILQGGLLDHYQVHDLLMDFKSANAQMAQDKPNGPASTAYNNCVNNMQLTGGEVASALQIAGEKLQQYEGQISAIAGAMAKIVDRAWTTIQAMLQNMSPR